MKSYYSYVAIGHEGYLLLTATHKSITTIHLLEDQAACVRTLSTSRPSMKKDDEGLKPFANKILAYLRGETEEITDVPLILWELTRSDFHYWVWRCLMAIPRGKAKTYKEIALWLGNANKARAVGAACGANPVPIIIPCHRVLSHDKGLGGYRWGLSWKKRLLSLEGVSFSEIPPS